jgi:putative RecB family exonuclease
MRIIPRLFHRRPAPVSPGATSPAAKPRTFSVSSTREYETCPRRYRYGYVERIPAERAAAPEHWRFGSVVHAGLEAGYRHHQAVGYTPNLRHTIPVALEAVRRSWVEEAMPDDPGELARAERVVSGSLATTHLAPRDILGVERWFRAEAAGGIRVAGVSDLVVRAGADTVEIRDHKVTRYVRTPEQLVGDLQLGVYGWLVRQTWPWAETVMVAHHYPLSRQIVRVELDDAWIDTAMGRLTGVAHAALHDSVFAPTPGDHCHTCAYSALCEAAPAVAA